LGIVKPVQVDIFIRSYAGDFNWLKYCLRSIKKYAKGFHKVHVCIPIRDYELLPDVGNVEVHLVEHWDDDYIGQQNDKLHADWYCRSPYILVMDSDCIFVRDVIPEDFFREGNPVWLYEAIPKESTPWYEITQEAIKSMPEFEFMRRHPFVFSRQSLRDFRDFMFNCHQEDISKWLKKRPFHRFSEFNAFGAWAYRNYYRHFTWLSPQEMEVYVMQKRSWDGLSEEIKDEFEKILA
jgi:Family of unknown function (DUF6492)